MTKKRFHIEEGMGPVGPVYFVMQGYREIGRFYTYSKACRKVDRLNAPAKRRSIPLYRTKGMLHS